MRVEQHHRHTGEQESNLQWSPQEAAQLRVPSWASPAGVIAKSFLEGHALYSVRPTSDFAEKAH